MSAFVVNITPPQHKTSGNLNRLPTDVIIAPFAPKSTVIFEDVPVSKTARRTLNIINTANEDIKVMLTKSLNPEYNMSMEWTASIIPSKECKTLEMVWNPKKDFKSVEVIHFIDNRNVRNEVSIVLKSIKNTKTVTIKKQHPTVSTGKITKGSFKSKSPGYSNNSKSRKSIILHTTHNKNGEFRRRTHEMQTKSILEFEQNSPIRTKMKINNTNEIYTHKIYNKSSHDNRIYGNLNLATPFKNQNNNKENESPETPNVTSLFDNIKFTPLNKTKHEKVCNDNCFENTDLDILASLPTPNSAKREIKIDVTKPIPINFSPEFKTNYKGRVLNLFNNKNNNDNLKNVNYNKKFKINKDDFECIPEETYMEESNLISPGKTYIKDFIFDTSVEIKISNVPIINKTFDLKNDTASSENILIQHSENSHLTFEKNVNNQMQPIDNTVQKKTTRLSSIAETEEVFRSDISKIQNKITPSLSIIKRDIKLVGTPLFKCSESLRDLSGKSNKSSICALGSMPDLNNMESLQSIEQNRYYYPQSIPNIEEDSEVQINIFESTDVSNLNKQNYNSNTDLNFNQNEIRAASSRFNMHETNGVKTQKMFNSTAKEEEFSISHKFKTPVKFNITLPSKSSEVLCKRNFKEADTSKSSNENLISHHFTTAAISPPKRTKFDEQFQKNEISTNKNDINNIMKWKSIQQIKKSRLQKTLTLTRNFKTESKVNDEPRHKFYNSENFLQHFINPDPFAATTTVDPFLAATMYLDELCIKKYEDQFKKWLNALVTMPSELDGNCKDKIDVGRLFNEVRNKKLVLAPTKEEQSMNYLTKSRMEALRSAACNLYRSQELSFICGKVAVYIQKGAIKIRSDRDLHLDIVLQKCILELLLCFNPLWLRLGLEVVFHGEIYLSSNSDVAGLITFILNRLFRDKIMEKKQSRAYTLSEEYKSYMKTFTLQKILFLLIFLDKAKNNRIIKHNPCLFVKQSPYKETKQILLRISSELLASVGDITKELRRLGYVLSHKQSYIDEFDYAFNTLSTDLRDGIRLTRIMEIILLREDLTNKLRYPAISRLQRIFNVNLALNALKDADFKLKGEITANDIVDGHREKTLSLLWQVIYKFRSPKFIAAATLIQLWWRRSWLKVVINNRIKVKNEIKLNKAATIIQALIRGFIIRKHFKIYKEKRISAIICLQKYCRMYVKREHYKVVRSSVICLQRWYRNQKIANSAIVKFLNLKCATIFIQRWYRRIKLAKKIELAVPIIRDARSQAKQEYYKALIIQRSIKSFIIHKKLKNVVYFIVEQCRKQSLEVQCATKIQAFLKMIKLRKQFLLKKNSVKKIQSYWRAYKLCKLEHTRFLEKRQAAIAIQLYFRSYLIKKSERKYYLELKKSTIFVQNKFRANKVVKKVHENFKKLRKAVVIIQQRFKAIYLMKKNKSEYKTLLKTTVMIQQKFRAKKLGFEQLNNYQKLKHAAIVIQSNYRALSARRNYINLKKKVILIQQKLRATLLTRKLQLQFITLQYYTCVIQQLFRGNKSMKREQLKFKKLKNAAIIIQQRFRARRAMIKQRRAFLRLRSAVYFIQTQYRGILLMRKEKLYFNKLKEASVNIQKRYRANKLMLSQKQKYQLLLRNTILIQQHFRANQLMKKERKNYIIIRNSTILIQTKFKAFIDMRAQRQKFILLKKSVIIIQQRYKAYKLMQIEHKNYKNFYTNVIKIQNRFRANRLMKKEKQIYLLIRKSIISIQRWWRATIKMQRQKTKYLLIKNSVKVIQTKFRAYKLMQSQHQQFNILRKNVVFVQQLYRANRLMKQNRNSYLKICDATKVLQNRWRANKEMRKVKSNYLLMQKSAIIIQIKYRAYKLMQTQYQKYNLLRKNVIFIQQLYRANYMMKQNRISYLKICNAVAVLQNRWRANKEMNKIRQIYLLKRKSAIIIQQKYRSYKLMQKERIYYENLYIAILTVQQNFKANYLMKREKKKYVKLRESTIKIQKWYKATKEMHKQKNKFLLLKTTCKKIQELYRAKKSMQLERNNFIRLKKSVILIEEYYKSIILMRKNRTYYLKLKETACLIQMKYRAKKQMQADRSRFLNIRESVIKIQFVFRSFIQMKIQRQEYLKMRNAAIIIQQKYRAKIKMLTEREKYLNIRNTVEHFQKYCRGFLARKHFAFLMTPEMRKFIQQRKAAKIIQKYWRGYLIRKRLQNHRLLAIRKKIREMKGPVNAFNTVSYKISSAVNFLNVKKRNNYCYSTKYSVQDELGVLLRLDKLSRTVPHLLMQYSEFIANYCYHIMAQAIRSEIDKQIIELCSRIILNLARYNSTTANTFQENGLITIAQMLLRWCDKESEIFNTLCTLIWIFSHCPFKNSIIRTYMTTPEAIFMLRETKKLLLRKEKMRQNIRRQSISFALPFSRPSTSYPKTLPSLEPDFGIIQEKHYIFNNSVFAFEVVLKSLQIGNIF